MIDDLTTNDVLKLFYHAVPYGWLELTLLKEGCYPQVHWLELPNQLNDAQLAYLHDQNEQGWNIYYGVTVRSERKDKGRGHVKDAMFTRVLWVDMDSREPQALKRLQAENPSLIIDSGGGYHGYWLLDHIHVLNGYDIPLDRFGGTMLETDNDLFKRTLKGMAIHLDADVKVAEFARILRLPGFKNMKPERGGAPCGVFEDRLFTYDLTELANKYAWLVKSEARVERAMPIVASDTLPKSVQDYLSMPLGRGERNNALNKAAYTLHCRGMNENEIYRTLSPRASADDLPDHEIVTTIRSACSAPVVQLNPRIAARDRRMVAR
jgi:hypothetical protein